MVCDVGCLIVIARIDCCLLLVTAGMWCLYCFFAFFFNDPATTEIYTLSLHDALPILVIMAAGDWLEFKSSSNAPGPAVLPFVQGTNTILLARHAPLFGWSESVIVPEVRSTPPQKLMRSEEHTSELQSPVPISYAVFCLKKKNKKKQQTNLWSTTYQQT